MAPAKTNRRIFKWLRMAVWVAAGLVLCVWLLDTLLLPMIVRAKFAATLAPLGLPDTEFHVDRASPWGTELSSIGGEGLQVSRLTVRFQPLRVLFGQLDSVEAIGLQLNAVWENGHLSLKGLGAKRPAPASSNKSAGGSTALPFETLRLRACLLVIDRGDNSIVIPFDGKLSPAGRSSKIDLLARILNSSLHLRGTLNAPAGTADMTADAENIDVASLLAFFPAASQQSIHAGGRSALSAHYQLAGGRGQTEASVHLADGWFAARAAQHVLVSRNVAIDASVSLDEAWRPSRLSIHAQTPTIALDQDVAVSASFEAHDGPGQQVLYTASLKGPEYQASLSGGQVTGLLGAGGPIAARARGAMSGAFPTVVAQALLDQGIDTRSLGKVAISADIAADLGHAATNANDGWRATLAADCLLERGDVRLTRANLTLGGVGAMAKLDASADASGLSVVLHRDATIYTRWAGSPTVGDAPVLPDDQKVDLIDFTLVTGDGRVFFPFEKKNQAPWKLMLPGLRLRLAPTSFRAGAVSVHQAAGVVQLNAEAGAAGASAEIDPGSWVGQTGTSAGAGGSSLEAGPFWAIFKSATSPNPSKIDVKPGAVKATVSLSAANPTGWKFAYGDDRAELKDLGVELKYDAGSNHASQLAASISLSQSALNLASPPLRIVDLSAKIPLNFGGAKPLVVGTFVAKSTQVGPDKWPGLNGTARFTDGKLQVTADWPILKQAALNINAFYDASAKPTPTADFHAWIPSFTLKTGDEIASLVSAAKGTSITGDFRADADIKLDRGRLTPKIVLDAGHANVKSQQYDAEIDDISSTITFDSFDPFSTPGNQQLTVGGGTIGKLKVSDGKVAFRVESPHSILIEQTGWGWAGGRLYTHALRIDPADPVFDFVAYGDDLSLQQIVQLVAGKDSTAEGRLYGRLPARVHWPQVEFGTGFLYAAPGSGGMNLGADAAKQVGDLLAKDRKLGSGGNTAMVRDRIVAALQHFHYDVFKLDLHQNDNSLQAAIQLRGSGKVGNDTQQLGLDLNVNGFDELLRSSLVIQSLLGK